MSDWANSESSTKKESVLGTIWATLGVGVCLIGAYDKYTTDSQKIATTEFLSDSWTVAAEVVPEGVGIAKDSLVFASRAAFSLLPLQSPSPLPSPFPHPSLEDSMIAVMNREYAQPVFSLEATG